MPRRAHLVGTWPGRDPEHAIELALKELAPYLDRMSDGETGDRRLWITPAIERFRANPDVELVHDGDWSSYENSAQWRVKDGVTLNPDNIRLNYSLTFENSFPSFLVLRDRFDRPDLRFQVSVPSPFDIAVASFGDAAFSDPSILRACMAATVHEIQKIFPRGGDEVVFQLETVVGVGVVAQAESDEQPEVATRMAAIFGDLVSQSPEGARFGIHLCFGDFHHKADNTMSDSRPLVLYANAIADGWPGGRTLEYIHVPFALAADPPVEDEAFYEPLRDLAIPDDVRFVAGFQHESLDIAAHKRLLRRIEALVGRQVDVAAACGLGRRDHDEEAFEQMRETAALLNAPSSA